jgi:hypothetical protein
MIAASLRAVGCSFMNFGIQEQSVGGSIGVKLGGFDYDEAVTTKFLPISRQSVSSF